MDCKPIMVVEELKSIRKLKGAVDNCRERLIRLRSAMEGVTIGYREGSRGTAEQDKMAANVATAIDLESQLLDRIVDLESRIQGVESIVEAMEGNYPMILRLRYFDNLRWSDVARRSKYDRSSCLRIHAYALEALNGITISRDSLRPSSGV